MTSITSIKSTILNNTQQYSTILIISVRILKNPQKYPTKTLNDKECTLSNTLSNTLTNKPVKVVIFGMMWLLLKILIGYLFKVVTNQNSSEQPKCNQNVTKMEPK